VNQRVLWGDVPTGGRNRLRCATSMLSPMFILKVGEATTIVEGIWSITHVTEARFKGWVEIWNRCFTLEKGFWDMATLLF